MMNSASNFNVATDGDAINYNYQDYSGHGGPGHVGHGGSGHDGHGGSGHDGHGGSGHDGHGGPGHVGHGGSGHDGHGGSGHDGHGHHAHAFNFASFPITILGKDIQVNSIEYYILTLIILFFFSLFFTLYKEYHRSKQAKRANSMKNILYNLFVHGLHKGLLYGIDLFLMLIMMTFDIGIIFVILLGITISNQISKLPISFFKTRNENTIS